MTGHYAQYLTALLAPLGVYDLSDGSLSGSMVQAVGTGLDSVEAQLERAEREALLASAEEEGVTRREALFAYRNAAVTLPQRRAAVAALMRIDGDGLTPTAINRAISGCGIRAKAVERGNGRLRVMFPQIVGVPPEFERVKPMILDILPCHLEIEFYFRYLTWEVCEHLQYTWQGIEARGDTWEDFQNSIPPEPEEESPYDGIF